MMLSAIFNTPVEVKHVDKLPETNLTDAKLTKLVYGILAVISFAIGYLALTVGTAPSLLLAIPCLAIGGTLTWIVVRMKDYQDPKKLEEYRSEAAKVPLTQTISAHGWKNMLLYEIPRKEAFPIVYQNCVKNMGIEEHLAFYEVAMESLAECKLQPSFEPIHPSKFQKEFWQEVGNLSAIQIFRKYYIEKLHQYGIVDQAFVDAKNDYEKHLKLRDEAKAGVHAEFNRECQRAKEQFRQDPLESLLEESPYARAYDVAVKKRNLGLEYIDKDFATYCKGLNAHYAS